MLTPELREYAEVPDRYALVARGGSVTRHDDGRVCVLQGATWASVTSPRVDEDELDDLIAWVHELVPPGKDTVWWLGPSSRPEDVEEQLRRRGFRDDRTPMLHAVALGAGPTGAYRALVRARWDLAAERGTPALVTHAVPGTSYRILKRLGFEDVCTRRRLKDER